MALPPEADIPLILSRIRPQAEFGWKGDGSSWSNPADIRWRDEVQVEPTLAELEAEWIIIEAERASAATVRQLLKAEYAPLVGLQFSALTNAQLKTMVEILVYILGGIDENTRKLKPASKWQVARELLDAT